jgi:hypothetical protein
VTPQVPFEFVHGEMGQVNRTLIECVAAKFMNNRDRFGAQFGLKKQKGSFNRDSRVGHPAAF